MINKLRKYQFLSLISVCLLISLGFYYLYTENQEKLFLVISGFIAVLSLVFLLNNFQNIPLFIAFITPLSIDYGVAGGTKLSLPIELVLLFLIFFFFLLFIIRKPKNLFKLNHPLTRLLIGLFLVMLLSSILGTETIISLKRSISFLVYIIGFYVFVLLFSSNSFKLRKIYFWYIIGMILPICNSLLFHSKFDFVQSASVYSALPFYDEHTIFGACIAFVIPFLVIKIGSFQEKKIHVGYALLTLFFFIALLHSYSRAAWISLVASGVFYLFIKFKGNFKLLMAILTVCIGMFWFNYASIYSELRRNSVKYSEEFSQHLVSVTNLKDDASNRERINRWVCAVRMFSKKPVLGFGPGTYQFQYGKFQTNEFTTRISTHRGDKGNAHSEYLMALSETGILGFIALILIMLTSLKVGLKTLKQDITKEDRTLILSALLGLSTFYVHGLFNAFSDSPKMAILFLGSLAIIVCTDNKYNKIHEKIVTSERNE